MNLMAVDSKRFFKGWAKPGPAPPGALDSASAIGPDETLDAISGDFRLFQLARGHRFSTDDVLTAFYGTSWCPCARRVLDLLGVPLPGASAEPVRFIFTSGTAPSAALQAALGRFGTALVV